MEEEDLFKLVNMEEQEDELDSTPKVSTLQRRSVVRKKRRPKTSVTSMFPRPQVVPGGGGGAKGLSRTGFIFTRQMAPGRLPKGSLTLDSGQSLKETFLIFL